MKNQIAILFPNRKINLKTISFSISDYIWGSGGKIGINIVF